MHRIRFVLRKVLIAVVVLFLVMTLLYFSTYIASISQRRHHFTNIEILRMIWDRYVVYIKNIILHWDWGVSRSGDSVWPLFISKVHYTMKITLASLVFFMVFGCIFGVIAAIKKNTIIDKLINGLSAFFSSIPSFILVWFLMLYLGWGLKLLPPIYPVGTTNPVTALLGLVIPVISLSLWPLSKFIQLVRGEIIENLSAEYMILVRTKGLTKTQGILRHLSKNTLVTIMPEITNSFLFVLTSSFLVEIIYNIQGVANLFYDSMILPFEFGNYISIDIPTTVLVGTFYVSFGVIMSLVFDVLYTVLDPRMKIGSNKYSRY
jgi:ABC-type dipeptide/oligopeptide/nickel transport system permease component